MIKSLTALLANRPLSTTYLKRKSIEFHKASISSINNIHRACLQAIVNKSLTIDGPTPTNISKNSEPETDKNGTSASPAVAFASNVLPIPRGPKNKKWKLY
ncbi:uncharacterized protein LOC132944605 [Metopolophium dirhodum]|uniref:uncharacterized protein LOC132944605 n=1 Tax=Metopolophium dirhodum TaxID=44670 RepID=UPI0029904CEF|nr:uncharacterized protein LOC132944605 [Metopolophium dirhodum]